MACMRLEGKRAIVTGAASGIGRAAAALFAAEGARVLAVDVAEAGLAETAAQIAAAGRRIGTHIADAGDDAAVRATVERCVAELGGLEVLFANAGISGGLVPLLDLSAADWAEVLRVNLI